MGYDALDIRNTKLRYPQFFMPESMGEHSSIILSLWLNEDQKTLVRAMTGFNSAEDLHLTLGYLGKIRDVNDSFIARAILMTEQIASSWSELQVEATGLGYFSAVEEGESDAVYLAVNSSILEQLRNHLRETSYIFGIPSENDWGFTPHITLEYRPRSVGALTLPALKERFKLNFGSINLTIAGKQLTFPFYTSQSTLGGIESEDDEDELDYSSSRVRLSEFFAPDTYEDLLKKNRDLGIQIIHEKVFSLINSQEMIPGAFMSDLFTDQNGRLYALATSDGYIYRFPLTVSQNEISLGFPEKVDLKYESVGRSTPKITRNALGRYSGFAIMSTAAVNKNFEIDSRRLFDCFVERFTGEEYINIYHLAGDTTSIGQIRYIFREGNLLVGFLEFDDTPMGRAVGETLSKDIDGKWGGSIEFYPDEDKGDSMLLLENNIGVPVYETGTLAGYSITLAKHGAAWYTGHEVKETRMSPIVAEAVNELLSGDQVRLAELQDWLGKVNERLADAITRSQVETPEETIPVQEDSTDGEQVEETVLEEDPQENSSGDAFQVLSAKVDALTAQLQSFIQTPVQIELDDSALERLNQKFNQLVETPARIEVLERVSAELPSSVAALQAFQSETVVALKEIRKALGELTRTEADRFQDYNETAPARRTVSVGWRARQEPSLGSGDEELDFAQGGAAALLAKENRRVFQ